MNRILRAVGFPGKIMVFLAISQLSARAQLFTETLTPLPAYPYPCVAWGDYDADGRMDLLIAGNGKRDTPTTTLYRNTGAGFVDSGIVLPGLARAAAAWGDFDNDGRLDLALSGLTASGLPGVFIYRNNGTNFTPVSGAYAAVFAGSVAWADYDSDGRLDLFVNGITSASANGIAIARLYHNQGNGSFVSVPHPFPNSYLGAVAWGDYNNDGKPDLLICGALMGGGLTAGLWRNEGHGVFTNSGVSLPPTDIGFGVWGDYDDDGDLDLLFGGNALEGWISRIYRNDAGNFTDINAGLLPVIWSSAAWGDYDNDGRLDAMIIGYDPVAQVQVSRLYRNGPGGTFIDSGQTFHNLNLGTVSWVDYDNDGGLDLLEAGNGNLGDELLLYRNNTTLSNTIPGVPSGLTATNLGPTLIMNWSGASDSQTPAPGLLYNVRVGTTPGGSDVLSSESGTNGYRRLAALGNAGSRLSAQVENLKPGTNYYWSVQAIDSAWAGGPFAPEQSFTILAPSAPGSLSLERATNGLSLQAIGTPGWTYSVLGTTNMAGIPDSWTRLGEATANAAGLLQFSDSVINLTGRFYRLAFP